MWDKMFQHDHVGQDILTLCCVMCRSDPYVLILVSCYVTTTTHVLLMYVVATLIFVVIVVSFVV